jgi:tripartite-type tricarboxylate transporter receptor subunit TctC
MRIKSLLSIFCAVCFCYVTSSHAWEPTKDIDVIVAYKQGSGTDTGARLLSSYADRYFKHKLIVKNLDGADGISGWDSLIKAKPDGYTIGFINLPTFATLALSSPIKMSDVVPICNHLTESSIVVVRADSPYKTIKDLVDDAKVKGNLLASTNGFMASNHTAAQLLAHSGGFDYIAVDCGGTSDQLLSLLNDEVQFTCVKIPDVAPLLKKEKPEVRILATFSEERLKDYPEVPTLTEFGYYDKWYGSSRGIVAPKGTPDDVIQYYVKTFGAMMADPEVIEAHRKANLALDYKDNLNFEATMTASIFFCNDIIPMIYKEEDLKKNSK